MLKRHGEPCQYRVPGFGGRLTETEYQAYTEAMDVVQDQVSQLLEGARTLGELETQAINWRELPVNGTSQLIQAIRIQGDRGAPWQILKTLSKTATNEILFCSRPRGTGQEYGIIEQFGPHSAYARAHGTAEVLMTSNDPKILIQDHLDNEKNILQLFRKDIQATVEETLAAKYPGENLSRVVKAVDDRCQCGESTLRRNDQTKTIKSAVRIRF
ncbi:MAG: hypothetical protein SFY81_02740 [Verrucomicrobiota bacterium]|nr:hypothetical protein [Verrucomicrobiota bacterium]